MRLKNTVRVMRSPSNARNHHLKSSATAEKEPNPSSFSEPALIKAAIRDHFEVARSPPKSPSNSSVRSDKRSC